MKDTEVIERFVAHLAQHGHQGLKVDEIPDEKERNLPEIDAIAGLYAIEHTSVDTVPNQRRNDNWFLKVIKGLQQELSSEIPCYLFVTLEYDAVSKGQDWKRIRQALKGWIIGQAKYLLDGDHILEGVSGIPFNLNVRKESDSPPGLFLGRSKPDDDSTLPCRIRSQLDKRVKKLGKYHLSGKTTILLVESSDFALMNRAMMRSSMKDMFANGALSGVDQVWYAERFDETNIKFTDFTSDL